MNIGHHDAGLDASGNWSTIMTHLRSYTPNAFRFGNAPSGYAWMYGNRPRNHFYTPAPLGAVYHKSSTILTGTQGPYYDKEARYAALKTVLHDAMKRLYSNG